MGRAWSPEERERACEEILAQVAKGKSLIGVCRDGDDWLPSESTFRFWCDNDPELAARYACARDLRADVIFEEILTIADSQEGDVIIVDGREVTNHDVIARAKLRVDARRWMIGKMAPKRYGDRAALEVSGPDGGPIKTITETMTPQEAAEAYAATLAADKG